VVAPATAEDFRAAVLFVCMGNKARAIGKTGRLGARLGAIRDST
jgi:hypothetical protein